jgi:hypothetical protein
MLAAESVVEVSEGFTNRPYVAGEFHYNDTDIQGFAHFLKANYIAMPVFSEQGVYMLFSMGISVLNNPRPEQTSWVLFGKNGRLTVHVSGFDYRQYNKRITFDQLCSTLGRVFDQFYNAFRDGNEARIITDLKSV